MKREQEWPKLTLKYKAKLTLKYNGRFKKKR